MAAAKDMGPSTNNVGTRHPTRSARRWVNYTPSASPIPTIDNGGPGAPRGVMTDTDTTVTMSDDQDTPEVITVATTAWVIIPFSPSIVSAVGGGNVYLIY